MNLNGRVTNPGELNVQVTLWSRSVTSQTGGFQNPGKTTIDVVWAKWRNVHGVEAWAAATQNALEAATVTIRYRDNVDQTCGLTRKSKDYEIVSIDNIEQRDEYLELKVQRIREG